MVHILKYRKTLLPSFSKISTRKFFYFIYWAKLNVLEDFFNNMIHTVKCYDCYFILGRYFSEYELVETYETNNLQYSYSPNKSSRFSVGFQRISRLGSAFLFLQWFKFADICIQVASLHRWYKQGIDHNFLIGNRFHVTLRIQIVYASCHNARSQVLRLAEAKVIFRRQDFCF